MIPLHSLIIPLAAAMILCGLASYAKGADDCPPRTPPEQVNCDEARGYIAAIGLRESTKRAQRCGYSLREILATVKRCGLK